MAKYEAIEEQLQRTALSVVESAECWKKFLQSAAHTYRNSFSNQLLIYAQRPNATACATIEFWNTRTLRWINCGSKSITVLDSNGERGKLAHLFDVSDTHPTTRFSPNMPWSITDQNKTAVLQQIQKNTDFLLQIAAQAQDAFEGYIEEAEAGMPEALQDANIVWAEKAEQLETLKQLAIQSSVFMVAHRFGMDTSKIGMGAFATVSSFDTVDAAIFMGGIVQRVSDGILNEIGRTVRRIDSVARQATLVHNETTTRNSQKEAENNGVYEHERVPDPQLRDSGADPTKPWQIRNDAAELSERTQAVPIRADAGTRNSVPEHLGAGAGGASTNRADDADADANAESRAAEPQNQPAGLGTVDERAENAGRGNGIADAVRGVTEDEETLSPTAESENESPSAFLLENTPENGQLSFMEEEQPADAPRGDISKEVAAALGLPSPDEQLKVIEKSCPNEKHIEPQKDTVGKIITDAEVNAYLTGRGSGFADGKYRIYRQMLKHESETENAKFLKNEYGIGGCSWEYSNGQSGFIDHDGKGLSFRYGSYSSAEAVERKFPWSQVARRMNALVLQKKYLSPEQIASYPDWLEKDNQRKAEQAAERARRDEEWAARQREPVVAQKRQCAVGDKVYLEDDHAFTIEDLGILDVQLRDEEYPIISRAINRQEFAKLLADNPRNSALTIEENLISPKTEIVAEYPAVENGLPYDIVVETLHTDPEKEVESEQISPFVARVEADVAKITANEPPYQYVPINYTAPYHTPVLGGPKERLKANIAAIEKLKEIEARQVNGGDPANDAEQKILAKYAGWGGLADAFDPNKNAWSVEYAQLKALLTEPEYNAARESTLTAFYTPNEVIRSMYRALERMGVTGGNILEPSMGVGAFFGCKPSSFDQNNAKLYGVELDDLTGRIAKQLYQKTNIQITGYEHANLPDSFFDCAIGNVPFGDFSVSDRPYDKLHFRIHDYFIAKTIDKVRTGGLIAFITTSGTLDKKSEEVRKYIAARCELIGAVRLPNTTFKANAGTEATADILFLQKRDRLVERDEPWLHLSETEDGIPINGYFSEHPEMVCGEMHMVSGPYGPTPTCTPKNETTLEEQMDAALQNLQATLTPVEIVLGDEEIADTKTIPADPAVRNYSYTLVDDKIYYRENSVMREVQPGATAESRIKKLIALRDTTHDLIQAQLENMPDAEIERLQGLLNRIYDDFHHQFGLINSRGSAQCFQEDSSYFLLCSLEDIDDDHKYRGKTDMFYKRTIRAAQPADHVDTATDALALSIGERARVDLDYMARITNKTKETLVEELTGVIFCDPLKKDEDGDPIYLAADEYLSGDVRQKFKVAALAAETDPAFRVNVQALKQVQPKDLEASEISVRLGSTWIPQEDIKAFSDELMDTPPYSRNYNKVLYMPFTGQWNVTNKSFGGGNIKATVTYGTSRANFYHILEESLNLRAIRIFDTIHDPDGTERRVLNGKETQAAQEKQRQVEDAFKNWIFKDQARRQRLVAYYNDHFNATRPREYDGSHIQFHGMNPEISLRVHQKNAIAHILYGQNTLLAHVVGGGKTYEMVAAAMEKRRLGLCTKTLICVPNHLTGQMASEALQLYPNANILVAKRTDFEKNNRKRFCAKIATGNYDIIVIGHSQFERIPLSQQRQAEYIQRQIDEIVYQQDDLKRQRAENFTIKQLERMKKQLKKRLEKLNDTTRKDDVVTFEELGVDSLMVDEAHCFKNLMCVSKMRNVAGISQTESQKASDLLMKCMYLDEITGGRGTVFATGTPIANSMTELYTMMRYLQHRTLEQNGLHIFDAWASTFGETVTAIELAPEGTGYRAKTRFAKFYNLPELMSIFKEAADIQTADMLKLPVPDLTGGKPQDVVLKPSDIQKEMVQQLAERAETIRNGDVDPTVDNMLRITNDGRKLALDQRLIDPSLPDEPNSKVNACVENVYAVWEKTREKRSTQLVFCDLSTPKPGVFNVYYDVRDKLIARGVPADEIQFIHDANTEARKAELFGKVRSGAVRILLGSTSKMGAGTNVQKKLVALHHLDVPWRPSDIEQREGRMIRQGNENSEVTVFRYVTEGTFDAYSWGLIENKQRFISQIMTSKSPARSCEDMDDSALSYAEVKALAAGNPLIREKMDLDIQVTRLKTLKAAYTTQHYRLEDALTVGFPAEVKKLEEYIKNAEADNRTLQANTHLDAEEKEIFTMTLMGTVYEKKEEAGKSLLGLVGEAIHAQKPVEIGSYKEFKLQVSYYALAREFHAQLVGAGSYDTQLGADTLGNITRINNLLNGLPAKVTDYKAKLEQFQRQIENAKEELQQPFLQEEELAQKSAKLAELDALLNMNEKDRVIDTAPEEETPVRKPRSNGREER